MRSSRIFVHVAVAVWGAALVYGCAVGGDEAEDGCVVGSEGCECTIGGGCDPGLACLSGFCVDGGGAGGSTSQAGQGGGTGGTLDVSSASGPTSTTSSSGAGPSTTAATTSTTTSSSSGTCGLAEPTNVMGCTNCKCDPWPLSWDAVPGATHYRVRYNCSIFNYESGDIFGTGTDFCNDVGACNSCGYSIGPVYVMACDGTCCTNGAQVPTDEAPITCGGGCCL